MVCRRVVILLGEQRKAAVVAELDCEGQLVGEEWGEPYDLVRVGHGCCLAKFPSSGHVLPAEKKVLGVSGK